MPAVPQVLRGKYTAAEGRKHRRDLLSQLKALVPSALVTALVEPLLDSGTFDPPLAVHVAMAATAQQPDSREVEAGKYSSRSAAVFHGSLGSGACASGQEFLGRSKPGPDLFSVLDGGLPAEHAIQPGRHSNSSTYQEECAEHQLASSLAVAQKAWSTCE